MPVFLHACKPQVFFMCSVPAATASRHFTHENRIELMRQNIVADTIVDGVGFKFPEYVKCLDPDTLFMPDMLIMLCPKVMTIPL